MLVMPLHMPMNTKFILKVAAAVALLNWILFFVLLFCFDDHFPGDPPPTAAELTVSYTVRILAFPLLLVVRILGHDPPYFFFSTGVLFLLSGVIWGVVVERGRHMMRRFSSRPLSS